MYTTIEPRLIALYKNDVPSTPSSSTPSLELPPLHNPNILKTSGRPLLLEPDASKRNGNASTDSRLGPNHPALKPSVDDDDIAHARNGLRHKPEHSSNNRALGTTSPQSLRKILGDDTDNTSVISSKKPRLSDTNKDEFVQLPQPPLQKAATKGLVPPIIIGLFEPPPQATLFPPIASSAFHDSHGRNSLNTIAPKGGELRTSIPVEVSEEVHPDRPNKKAKRRHDVRPRKKWTEDETKSLLLGVDRHGVGNWADILADPDFVSRFNNRSGADLKDRFRTCCPAELRGSSKPAENTGKRGNKPRKNPPSSLSLEDILEGEDPISSDCADTTAATNPSHKRRAHRKNLEDLVELGISGPFKKSQRRERQPFTEEDDRAILEGYDIYGPQWSRIQREPRFNLQNRQPTDLRDRFRNRYPEKFRSSNKNNNSRDISSTTRTQMLSVTPISKPQNQQNKDKMLLESFLTTNTTPPPPFTFDKIPTKDPDPPPSSIIKDRSTMATTSSRFLASTTREGLRIEEIISPPSQQESSPPKLDPSTSTSTYSTQASLFKDSFNNFPDQGNIQMQMDTSEVLPFPMTQSFDSGDWCQTETEPEGIGISAPFQNSIGEMDISRLLLGDGESWADYEGNK